MSLDPGDWEVINRIVDQAMDEVLGFVENMKGDADTVPSQRYFNRRLEAARARLYWRKALEGKSVEEIHEVLKAELEEKEGK